MISENIIHDTGKTLWDSVQEGNLAEVKRLLNDGVSSANYSHVMYLLVK